MEHLGSRKEFLEHPSSAEVINFFKEAKQIMLDALEMSTLPENQKKKIIAAYNKFIQDLGDPGLVERTMVVFDSKNKIHRVKSEGDGSYNLQIATHVFLGPDYLGSEMLGLFTENKTESREIYNHIKEEIIRKWTENL